MNFRGSAPIDVIVNFTGNRLIDDIVLLLNNRFEIRNRARVGEGGEVLERGPDVFISILLLMFVSDIIELWQEWIQQKLERAIAIPILQAKLWKEKTSNSDLGLNRFTE